MHMSSSGARHSVVIYKPRLLPALLDQTGLFDSPMPNFFPPPTPIQSLSLNTAGKPRINSLDQYLLTTCLQGLGGSNVQFVVHSSRGTNPFMVGRKQLGCEGSGRVFPQELWPRICP